MSVRHEMRSSHKLEAQETLTLGLAGQPNVGKSTVFNMLTGMSQHVGNWPGKTIERKSGILRQDGMTLSLVDLPGTYSLTANSEEERIARDFIIHEKPDVVVAVVNAAALERGLYLVAELLALKVPVVVALNMMDVAENHGVRVEPHVLEAALGLPVVPLVATRNQGLRELVHAAVRVAEQPAMVEPNRPALRPEHQRVLEEMRSRLAGRALPEYPVEWLALKLLEGDSEITEQLRETAPEVWEQIHLLLLQHEDALLDIAGSRYEWIGRMVRAAVERPKGGSIAATNRIDRIATHPWVGLGLLLGVLGFVFWLTYALAAPIMEWLDAAFVGQVMQGLRMAVSDWPLWLSGLALDGIVQGAGTVLSVMPVLLVFFAALGFLEDVGYLTRAAYVMDRFMHAMGLHGRSFVPLFLGFGCNVPAVLGSRIVEDKRARLLTILITPLVPCTGRMAVMAFLAPALFGRSATVVSLGLVATNLVILMVVGIAINRLVFKGEHTAFIMEMPLYHLPNLRTIALYVWQNMLSFVRKAGTVIVIVSAVVWALSTFPHGEVETSYLAALGRELEPMAGLMGFGDWRLITALLASFVAKENSIAVLGILLGQANGVGLAERVATLLEPRGALSFLVMQMLFIPCLATWAVIRQETGSWKWTATTVALQLGISLTAGILIYQVSGLF